MKSPITVIRQLAVPILGVLLAAVVVLVMIGWLTPGDLTRPSAAIKKIAEKVKSINLSKTGLTQSTDPKEDKYVAVYLENGKVYFGRISGANSVEPVLTDVYYLSVAADAEGESRDGEFQLVKLTDQFQAPTDRLVVTRDSILFWEPLSDDSKVVVAIDEFHKQQK